ncbi:MAG: hypothetical protein PHO08_16950 [Methylococcales bacterium]|nr:hypothetical protein [Methylococcales bacterium]
MDKTTILTQVNKFVAVGLRKTAINLIEEYLEEAPHDPVMLRTLGRIYLLEKKPDQAIKYLQLSLKNHQSKTDIKSPPELYELNDLNGDDLEYIDQNAEHSQSTYVYSFEDKPDNLDNSATNVIFKKIIQPTSLNPLSSLQSNKQKNKEENHSIQTKRVFTHLSDINDQTDFNNKSLDETKGLTEASWGSDINGTDGSPHLFSYDATLFPLRSEPITATNNRQVDLFEEDISEDEFVEEIFEEDEETEFYADVPELENDITEKEFSWDDFDEFDEIDEQDTFNPFPNDQILTEDTLDRWERAKQKATEVIQSHDWDKETLTLLQQVFYENGWAAARVAIERELVKGLTPEELELALCIRNLWTENHQYWISFIHITSNQPGQQTRAAYKNMSWAESLRIIRSFNNIPSEEEIQLFIDQIYDDWYCSAQLQRQFKAFIKYLKYRTGSVRRTLPGNEIFSFVDSFDKESLLDSRYDFIKQAAGIEALKQERIDIERMLTDIEQIYTVIKPEGIYGDESVYGDY